MFLKKFYIPIGLCVLLVLAIGFLSLRSDVPIEPIKIYKVVEPLPKSTAEVPVGDTSQGGHWHGDEWHADLQEPVVAIERIPTSTSEVSEVLLSEILSKYPDYKTMDAWNQANVRRWVRKEKILAEKEARLAYVKRKVVEQEAAKQLLHYVDSTVLRLETEYPDVDAFNEKYPDAQKEDFIREYPNATERNVFFARALEAGKIRREMADRILATPGMPEQLSSRHLEILHNFPSVDEISAALEILRSQGGLDE